MKKVNKLAVYALLTPALTVGAGSVYAQTSPHTNAEDGAAAQRTTQDRESSNPHDSIYSGSNTHSGDAQSGQRPSRTQQQRESGENAASASARRQDMQRPDANEMHQAGMMGKQLSEAPANAFHANSLLGEEVRSQAGEDSAGTINDLVIDEDGQVIAAVVGIGGLLGIGERNVAVSWDELQRSRNAEGELQLTTSMSQDALRDAPDYDHGDDAMDDDARTSKQKTEETTSY